MVSSFDMTKLCSLLQDFHMLTQIRITVFNDRLEELTAWPQHVPPFCRLIRSDPDGLAQCRKCDREACATALQKRGTHIYPGHNVGRGSDDTLFAKVTGRVRFERLGKDRKQVSVYEIEQ